MKWLSLMFLCLSACCCPAWSRSPFDGSWKIDLSKTRQPAKPDVFLLQGGEFQCQTCDPAISVKADGTDQQIAGNPCYDTVNIKVLSDRVIEETDRRNGKPVRTLRIEVSQSNDKANFDLTDRCNKNSDPVSVRWLATRVAQAPAGSHVVSGSWRTIKQESASENALMVTLKLVNNTFSFMDPTGQGYSAKLDGTYAPFVGGVDKTVVSVRRIGTNAIEETDIKDGKAFRRTVFTVSADGKTMNAAITDLVQDSTIQFVLNKQQ